MKYREIAKRLKSPWLSRDQTQGKRFSSEMDKPRFRKGNDYTRLGKQRFKRRNIKSYIETIGDRSGEMGDCY